MGLSVRLFAPHIYGCKSVVLKPWPPRHMWPERPSGVAREAIFIGKKT